MKTLIISFILPVAFSTNAKENTYTGSTPANAVVRLFLGIPLNDSVDFIRWQLVLDNNNYTLTCNYGIGKPNTNGFINGGENIKLSGTVIKEENYYRLQNDNKNLKIAEVNRNLLHLLDATNNLLVGNSGWSYTLNNITPVTTDEINLKVRKTIFKDSAVFEGRTPCGVPGVISEGITCYKLKWHIVLYASNDRNMESTYRILGTAYRNRPNKTGTWKMITGKDGRIIYQLNDESGKGFLYFLKLNDDVLVFTDAYGNLLVGNEDFSYTMNRINK